MDRRTLTEDLAILSGTNVLGLRRWNREWMAMPCELLPQDQIAELEDKKALPTQHQPLGTNNDATSSNLLLSRSRELRACELTETILILFVILALVETEPLI